ncbi:hypothetical protein QQ045_015196 [Rhodiola kirilowii]
MKRLITTSLRRMMTDTNRSILLNPFRNFRHFSNFTSQFEPGSWQSVEGLVQSSANYAPLSPISFLEKAARAYEDRVSVIYGQRKFTYAETHRRCVKLASTLSRLGRGRGHVAAPTVLNMIVNSKPEERRPLPHKVDIMTGGSPPPPQILLKMEELGFRMSHLYDLNETYGPGTYCNWKFEWDSLQQSQRSKQKARQGVQSISLENVNVKDLVSMESVPADGKTVSEIMIMFPEYFANRSNLQPTGYLEKSEMNLFVFPLNLIIR